MIQGPMTFKSMMGHFSQGLWDKDNMGEQTGKSQQVRRKQKALPLVNCLSLLCILALSKEVLLSSEVWLWGLDTKAQNSDKLSLYILSSWDTGIISNMNKDHGVPYKSARRILQLVAPNSRTKTYLLRYKMLTVAKERIQKLSETLPLSPGTFHLNTLHPRQLQGAHDYS